MLVFEGVSKRFGAGVALSELDLSANSGAITAVIGPNGAGKSTAFKIAVGLLEADAGAVKWRGSPIRAALHGSQIGFLPEERGLYQDVCVEHLLRYWGALRGLTRPGADAATRWWLKRMDLVSRRNEIVRTLSKGNQQKLQLAACLLHGPELVVLDEPFSGLDPQNQEEACDVIRAQRERGAVVIISAHQLPLVERLADHVVLLSGGRHLEQGILDVPVADSDHPGQVVRIWIREFGDLGLLVPELGGTLVERAVGYIRVSFDSRDLSELFSALATLASSPCVSGIEIERNDLHRRYVEAIAGLGDSGSGNGH